MPYRPALAALAVLALAACSPGVPPRPTAEPAPATASPTASPRPRPASSPPGRWLGWPCQETAVSRAVVDTGPALVFTDARTGFVTKGRNLYRTRDGGRTWRHIRTLTGEAYDVVTGGCGSLYLLYAGPVGSHVDRSDDDGTSWFRIATSTTGFTTLAMTTPYAGFALAPLPDGSGGGTLYETVDGGAHWRLVTQPGTRTFSVSATATGRVLAGVPEGVARSDDFGFTWRTADAVPDVEWTTVRVALGTGRAAWALLSTSGERRLRHTRDLTVWSPVAAGLDGDATLAARGAVALLAGVAGPTTLTTTDGGLTFVRGDLGASGGMPAVAWTGRATAVAAVEDDRGVRTYRTTDAGRTWRLVQRL